MKKLKPKQIRKITMLILVLGAVLAFLGVILNELVPLIITGIVILFVSIIFHMVMYRCPHCGRYLGRSTGNYCPYCSKDVNE